MKPKLLIIAGPNGSGKTSVTGTILKHEWVEGCEYINPDIIARDKFGDWNSHEAVFNAAKYATELRERLIKEQKSLIFETVLSSKEKIDFVEKAKNSGFFVRLFFIGTDTPQINAARVAKRVMNGGHDVPINKIISRYDKSIANCAVLAQSSDRLYVYDNSINDIFPKLLFRANNGILTKQYQENINEWATPIFGKLKQLCRKSKN
jgi:predicted ABC-type ATPase